MKAKYNLFSDWGNKKTDTKASGRHSKFEYTFSKGILMFMHFGMGYLEIFYFFIENLKGYTFVKRVSLMVRIFQMRIPKKKINTLYIKGYPFDICAF